MAVTKARIENAFRDLAALAHAASVFDMQTEALHLSSWSPGDGKTRYCVVAKARDTGSERDVFRAVGCGHCWLGRAEAVSGMECLAEGLRLGLSARARS